MGRIMRTEIEKEIADEGDAIDSLLSVLLVLVVVAFCAFWLGLIWQLASPLVAEVLTAVWGWVK